MTQANNYSDSSSLSADGRYLAFACYPTNLVADDTNAAPDIFVRGTCAGVPVGCVPSTVRTSVGSGNLPVLSANGESVVFASSSNNLIFGDTNGHVDIFLARTGR
jgi:Tol biopolymer transport system component